MPVVLYFAMAAAGMLPYIQIALSVLLIVCILLQQTGASLGGAFGGDNFSAGYHTRRGSEKYLFYASIGIGILFAATAFLALVIQ
jgi:protein translocase SecG subunit